MGIYPGRGIRYVLRDGKVQLFINHKVGSLFKQKIKPAKLTWTLNWRRKNKKGKADEAGKKRTKRAAKVQKAIVGMSLEDIKKKKAMKPELRAQAKKKATLQKAAAKVAAPKQKGGAKTKR